MRLFLLSFLAGASGLLLPGATAQDGILGMRFVPEISLSAPVGTIGVVETATSVTASNWAPLGTVVFTNQLMRFVDQRDPVLANAFYRLSITSNNGATPPFPAPLTNFLWVASGKFTMGSPDTDLDAASEETPQFDVTLASGFFMGRFEVTQVEYSDLMGGSPAGDDRQPQGNLSWNDATNYCAALNAREQAAGRLPAGWAYRLPTEAEWEYVARAGSTNRFSYGNDDDYVSLSQYAWFGANASNATHIVGTKLPNAWGFYDMYGNVCEWCQDWFDFYPDAPATDPMGPDAGYVKVFRGGGFDDAALDCRAAARRNVTPSWFMPSFGMRVILARAQP